VSAEYLCEISLEKFENFADRLTENQRKRAYHAITENGRTIEFYEMLKMKRYADAGKLLFASHHSLRDNFEVSTPELDQLVEWAAGIPGCVRFTVDGRRFRRLHHQYGRH
jgi:galactokinase